MIVKIDLVVNARHELDGREVPVSIVWEDGRVFTVDRVLDRRRAASLKGGGIGMRFICRICGRRVVLFEDEGKWFMEK